jgi:hypothetical protein
VASPENIGNYSWRRILIIRDYSAGSSDTGGKKEDIANEGWKMAVTSVVASVQCRNVYSYYCGCSVWLMLAAIASAFRNHDDLYLFLANCVR